MKKKEVLQIIKQGLNDDNILKIVLREDGFINGIFISQKSFNLYSELKEYLDNRFPKDEFLNYKQVIYRIKNKIYELPICPTCGNKILSLGAKHCSQICMSKDTEVKIRRSEHTENTKRKNKKLNSDYYKESFKKSSEGYKKWYEENIRNTKEYQIKLFIKCLKKLIKEKINEDKANKKLQKEINKLKKKKKENKNITRNNKDLIKNKNHAPIVPKIEERDLIKKINDYIKDMKLYEHTNMYGYIYKITINNEFSSLNNKYYIGKKKGNPYTTLNYFGSGVIISNYCRKYKKICSKNLKLDDAMTLGLTKVIIGIANSLDELNKLEIKLIDKNKSSMCINLSKGGDGHRGDPWNKGLTKETDERLLKMSENMKGNNRFLGENQHPWNYKKHWSEEQKKKISDGTKKGMAKMTLEEKKKLRTVKDGHPNYNHSNHKNSKGQKFITIDGVRINKKYERYIDFKYKCLTDNLIFNNLVEVAKFYNIPAGEIVRSCTTSHNFVRKEETYYQFEISKEDF